MKITFLFPKNYKHGLLGDEFYTETIDFLEEIDLYTRFSVTNFVDEIFKRTSIWNKLNHFSYKPYFKWKEIFSLKGPDLFIFKAISLIKIIYKNYELNYLHNPTFKEVIFDFYLIYGINVKIKKHVIPESSGSDPVIPTDFFTGLSGDYCIDISDFEKISENQSSYQDVISIENPYK